MPFYLIRITNRSWDRDLFNAPWLGLDEIPADVHQDLRISQSSLSVWHIEDAQSNLEQVITALASTRDSIDTFDYGLFEQDIVRSINIKFMESLGISPMQAANHWHRDLVELTVDKLARLIRTIFGAMEKRRKSKRDIELRIIDAVRANEIDLTKVKPKMLESINKRISL